MEVLGEDQRMALAEALRAGVPKSPQYASVDFDAAIKQGKKFRQETDKGLANLSAAGDGSMYEGMKNKLGVGNPNIYADNYQEEFGQFDPAFNAESTMPVAGTMPAGTQTGGMYGSPYRGNGR
jgi:hypothetical protein